MKIKSRYFSSIALLFVLLAAFAACDRFKAPVKQEYGKDGLAFAHFSNWTVTEDKLMTQEVGDVRYVSVEGPNDSLLMISGFPANLGVTLEDYVRLLQTGMNEEAKKMTHGIEVLKTSEGNLSPVETVINGAMRKGLAREFDVEILSIPVPHRSETFMLETKTQTWFFVAQSSKEDWGSLKNGFQTIFESLAVETETQSGGGQVK